MVHFLLDDDPFANLTVVPVSTPVSTTPVPEPSPPRPPPPRRVLVPASRKPAFAPKPSLPSLDTLSRVNLVLPKKLRKGCVGASLPFEPWDNISCTLSNTDSSSHDQDPVPDHVHICKPEFPMGPYQTSAFSVSTTSTTITSESSDASPPFASASTSATTSPSSPSTDISPPDHHHHHREENLVHETLYNNVHNHHPNPVWPHVIDQQCSVVGRYDNQSPDNVLINVGMTAPSPHEQTQTVPGQVHLQLPSLSVSDHLPSFPTDNLVSSDTVPIAQYQYSSWVEAIADWRDATHRDTITLDSTGLSTAIPFVDLELGIPSHSPQPPSPSLPLSEAISVSLPKQQQQQQQQQEVRMLAPYSSSSPRLPASSSSGTAAPSTARAPPYVPTATTTSTPENDRDLDQLGTVQHRDIAASGYVSHTRGQSVGDAAHHRSRSGNTIRTSGSVSQRSRNSIVEDEDGHSRHRGHSQSRRPAFHLSLPGANQAAARHNPSLSVSRGNLVVNPVLLSSKGEEDGPRLMESGTGEQGKALALPSPSSSSIASATSTSSSDNVPLAKSIPTALTAQRSIRKQVREERDQRRRERAGTAASAASSTSRGGEKESARTRPMTLRSVETGGLNAPLGVYSSSQGTSAAISRSRSTGKSISAAASTTAGATRVTARTRTQTLPSPGCTTLPLSADELTNKLQDAQESSVAVARGRTSCAHKRHPSGISSGMGYVDTHPTFPLPTEGSQSAAGTLRPQRSFHRPSSTRPTAAPDDYRSIPLPPNATHQPQLHRAKSHSRLRAGDDYHHTTLKPSLIEDMKGVPPVPAVPKIEEYKRLERKPSVRSAASTRPSMEPSHGANGGGVERRSSSKRPNTTDRDRAGHQGQQRPPVPPLPPAVAAEITAKPIQMTQQRVFIGDMQSYNVVEIDDSTAAGDVIELLESRGSLKGWIGKGDWMIWEVVHDFGVERPIRHYERLSDVQASWNKDKLVNMFVARLTLLAPLLTRSAIPSSSPVHSGYVEWESKRGKWSKRWLQLREHSLWISKRDSGKDETLLCSLSNFDAYHFTRPHKSPKSFVFALKSTDKLSFFENMQDYKHVISCSEREGKIWMEKILLARSYVLHQERNVLFNPKSYGGQPMVTSNVSGTLSRAATTRRPTPSQPLVSTANTHLFEPGSLLHRQG